MMMKRFVENLSGQKDTRTKGEMVTFFARSGNTTNETLPEFKRTLERIDANIRLMQINDLAGSQRSL